MCGKYLQGTLPILSFVLKCINYLFVKRLWKMMHDPRIIQKTWRLTPKQNFRVFTKECFYMVLFLEMAKTPMPVYCHWTRQDLVYIGVLLSTADCSLAMLSITLKNLGFYPLLICSWILKNQVGKIKCDELNF